MLRQEHRILSVALALAALLLLILPLNHTAGLRNTLLVAGFGLVLWQHGRAALPTLPALKWLLLAWVVLTGASALWSQNAAFSLREFKLETLLGGMGFWLFLSLGRDEKQVRWFFRAVAAAVIVTALLAMYRILVVGVPNYHWDELNDPWGWQQGFVSYSTYLVLAFPAVLYLLWRGEGADRGLAGLALVLMLWAGWATQNRMFWVAMLAVFASSAGLWYLKSFARLRSRVLPLVAIGVMLLGMAGAFSLVAENRPANALVADSATGMQAAVHTLEHSERFLIWHYWLGQVPQHPWLGVGFGRDLPRLVYQKPADWPELFFAHAHNVFIDVLLQLGAVGLTLFVLLLAALALRFWGYFRSDDAGLASLGLFGLSFMVAFAGKNFTDDMFWRTDALFFWCMIGLTLGLGERLHVRVDAGDVRGE